MTKFKKIYIICALLVTSSASYAGENSQATLGDVKEAVYKLIVDSKKSENRIKTVEDNFSQLKINKEDKTSLYIGNFVKENKEVLSSIAN